MNKIKIAIYGVGAFGKIFYESLKDDYEIVFFIDEFTSIKEIYGKKVYKPQDVLNIKVFISVLQFSKQIEEKLKSLEFSDILSFQKSILQNPKIFSITADKSHLWLTKDKTKMINEKLDDVKQLLNDKKSKDILEDFIYFRKTLNPKYYVKPKDKEYFPSDIKLFEKDKNLNIVDCGAYTGDSLSDFVENFQSIDNIISFEPDTNNIGRLMENISILKNKYKSTNFLLYPSGVYSQNTILKFNNNRASSSSCFDDSSSFEISVVSLDKTLLGLKVDYIKMDVEGAEKEALLGAKNLINKYKPSLAICLYHKPEDLWELPLLIKEIEPSYNFYLRVHEDMFLSTVLYCIPAKE